MNQVAGQYEPTSMPDEFREWMEDCPVECILNSDNGNARVEYTFFDPQNVWEY